MSTVTLTARAIADPPTPDEVREQVNDNGAASVVGWFSIALGAAEVVAPHGLSRLIGIESSPRLMKVLGAREIASGIGILTNSRPSKWVWARVAGDLMDLAVLGTSPLRKERGARAKLAVATAAVVGVTLLDVIVARKTTSKSVLRRNPQEQLVHFLSDMYSVEQQALAQLVSAPEIVGEPRLAEAFRQHYVETEQQADLLRERLEAHGGAPSRIKDAVMRLGGKGFLLFAQVMLETPGRLVDHAYSYEAMEWAGYQMLMRFAERAGDHETVETARTIGAQERAMMVRLERGFDAAEEISHAGNSQEDMFDHLRKHLGEVHAFESQGVQLLARSEDIAGNQSLKIIYRQLLDETRKHARFIEQRLESHGTAPSKLKDSALAIGGFNWSLFFQAQSDTPAKLAAFVYAVLHLEIGGYELLKRTAQRSGDDETKLLCEVILKEKGAMAEHLANAFDTAVEATLVPLQQ